MRTDFERVAIVNRGEPAMRFLHAAREYRLEHGVALTTIALYTEPDRSAFFVREADEAYALGPATRVDPRDGQRKISYLDYELLEHALEETRAEAVWVGWGLVAEHAAFADLCARKGIVFIGPSGDVMRRLGDKISSKLLAEESDVPVSPWSGGPVDSLEAAGEHAARLGFPLMVKATAGGGGRGIRRVTAEADLADAFTSARSEALKAFGDGTVFLEKLVPAARHVEVQMIADGQGGVWALGVRDCTIQRRHQKVLEETPSPTLTEAEDRELRAAGERLFAAAGYRNAGTVEFLFDPDRRQAYFMEVNARLQVEHPVTELVTGADLVKLQLHVARGGRLEGEPPAAKGHAIEVRLNAEDPDNAFAPSPGKVEVFRPARGPGLRVDTGVEEGDEIAPEFDSMIAKLMAWGATRDEALARLRRGVSQTAIVIHGGASNKGFLQELLARPEVASGEVDVQWLDRMGGRAQAPPGRAAAVALLEAAVEAYEEEVGRERDAFWAAAARGRPQVGAEVGRKVDLRFRGAGYPLRVYRTGQRTFRLRACARRADGVPVDVEVEQLGRHERRLHVEGRTHRIFTAVQGADHLVEVDGVPHRISRGEQGVVRSPAPAVVVSIAVAPGDEVSPGDRLAVLEAMKMETAVTAEFAGRVRKVLVRKNVQVGAGAPLLVVDPSGDETADSAGPRVGFRDLAAPEDPLDPRAGCLHNLERLRHLLLGWDTEPGEPARRIAQHGILCRDVEADDDELRRREDELLAVFVDVASLFRRRPPEEEVGEESGRRSSEEYLFTYLRDPLSEGAGLPAPFLDNLRRALAHYGIDGLEPTPQLREALFRMYRSYQQMTGQVAPVLSVLDRRLGEAPTLAGEADESFHRLLHRLIEETRDRFPAVHDLGREVHYRYLDEPFLGQIRDAVYREAEAHLDALEAEPDARERDERVAALVELPQPLEGLFTDRFAAAGETGREAMLEVLVRRLYRIRPLENVQTLEVKGQAFATADYERGGGWTHVVASEAPWEEFDAVARLAARRMKKARRGHSVVADFLLTRDAAFADRDGAAEAVRALIAEAGFPRRLRRVAAGVSTPSGAANGEGREVYYFTFRSKKGSAWEEDRPTRGLHPMMVDRLQLWRLENFAIERVPSADDVYAFYGTAHDNPRDERLFVIAEVRDLTPLTDEAEDALRFPHLERMFMEALGAIRRFQSRRPPDRRLHWNRVTLYVWPTLDLPPATLRALIRRLAPAADGLGLQKVVVRGRMRSPKTGRLAETVLELTAPAGRGLVMEFRPPREEPIESLSEYKSEVVRLRQRGLMHPYELIRLLAPSREGVEGDLPPGEFDEYDLDDDGRPVPVDREPGSNEANVVLGIVRNFVAAYPEGMERVILVSDPLQGMGSLAEAECRRILAALDLADERGLPLEWFAISAGAKISMESGTENMDWIARVLRKLVEHTQRGGEVNLVVAGINVGAQPYWNAEATMLMHTRGALIMTPEGAMVLTGKQALDYSGGVSAEDNQGIGGYERIMGPNGQAQYFARDLGDACRVLLAYYERTYAAPGERFPRRRDTADPNERDVSTHPHGGGTFGLVGEIFSAETNPGRKKPFDIRRVMEAVVDHDRAHLERWVHMKDAEIAVVWDAFLGGRPVSLVGFESEPLPRLGFRPADGPDTWTSGTLFPLSSKKVARAINVASGRRPLVLLANLSGFDGSPESLRKLQLEYGAEIGRAVVNFRGPIVFCVISRYHGGAFVVFSAALNDNMQVAALEGSYASVIGGAPAAAVVFARRVDRMIQEDPRIEALEEEIAKARGTEQAKLRTRLEQLAEEVRSEKLGEVAAEFDRAHSVHRAKEVGSVHEIIDPERLRPWLIEAVERGIERTLEEEGGEGKGRRGWFRRKK